MDWVRFGDGVGGEVEEDWERLGLGLRRREGGGFQRKGFGILMCRDER